MNAAAGVRSLLRSIRVIHAGKSKVSLKSSSNLLSTFNCVVSCEIVKLPVEQRRQASTSQNIDPTKTVTVRNTSPKPKVAFEKLLFGHTFTDHMLSIDWHAEHGWDVPKILPYGDFSLSPATVALHYGLQCFEGMKAYKDSKGNIRLFRPDRNMSRLRFSMERLAMPSIDEVAALECIKQLLRIDESWIPDQEGYSLYIRPTAIGTSPILGVHASEQVKLYTILSPVGPYYKGGFKPVKLYADTENTRAWPGGAGNAKVGGNYAPTIAPSIKAAKLGCAQILWLYGPDHQVTEVGAMNIFFVFKKAGGGTELVTAPLSRGDILPGVTRSSVLELCRGWNELEVSERFLTMKEVALAAKEGRLLESFCAGTAAVINPVRGIVYQGEDVVVPTGDHIGPVAQRLFRELMDIQYGRVEHPWSVVV